MTHHYCPVLNCQRRFVYVRTDHKHYEVIGYWGTLCHQITPVREEGKKRRPHDATGTTPRERERERERD